MGDPLVRVNQISTLERATAAEISFLTNSKYHAQLVSTAAGAVILGEADADATAIPRIISSNPYAYFAKVSALLNPLPVISPGVHSSAVVSGTAKIDPGASVAAMATIGEGVVIGAGSIIGEGCCIGDRVVIGAGELVPLIVVQQNNVLEDYVFVVLEKLLVLEFVLQTTIAMASVMIVMIIMQVFGN